MKNPLFKKGIKPGTHRIGEGVEKMIRIRSIRSPQALVKDAKVKKFKGKAEDMPPVVVSHAGHGVYTLKDGNHRAVSALLSGKRKIKAKVQKFEAAAKTVRLDSRRYCSNPARFINFDELQPHQKRVIRRIQDPNQPGLVVAHGVGSGKTRTSIEAAKALDMDADVIVPAALKGNYQKEIEKWGADPSRLQIQSQQRVATSEEPLKSKLLIVDEGHRGRNPKTKLSDAIKSSEAKKRLILTGTPNYNNPADIATIVNQAAGKNVIREGKAFETRYLRPGIIARWQGRHLSNESELKKILNRYVDYHKGDPSMLPKVTAKTIPVEMGKRQSEIYRATMGRIPKDLAVNKENIERLRPYLTGPRQVSNTARAVDPTSNEEPKLDRAFADLRKHLENPKGKALVYSNWLEHGIKPIQKRLTEAGIPHGVFTGSEPMKLRNQTVKDYNEGRHRALLVSSSGAEGLDLKGTRLVQVLEPHFNNAKIRQVVGRSARMGSHAALDPEDRHVEVRQYVGRPKNRWLPGHGKGVEDMLAESSRKKDEVDRQITALLSSKAKLIQFTRPEEQMSRHNAKAMRDAGLKPPTSQLRKIRTQNILAGTEWSDTKQMRKLRDALISTADPVRVDLKRGKRKTYSRVVSSGGRDFIEDYGIKGGGEVPTGNTSEQASKTMREPGKRMFYHRGIADTNPSRKVESGPKPSYEQSHFPSDWRDTEAYRKAKRGAMALKKANQNEPKPENLRKESPAPKFPQKKKSISRIKREIREAEGVLDTPEKLVADMAEKRKVMARDVRINRNIVRAAQKLMPPPADRSKLHAWSDPKILGERTAGIIRDSRKNLGILVEQKAQQHAKAADTALGRLRDKIKKSLKDNYQSKLSDPELNRMAHEHLRKVSSPYVPDAGKGPMPKPGFVPPADRAAHYDDLSKLLGTTPERVEKIHQGIDRLQRSTAKEYVSKVEDSLINSGRIFSDVKNVPKPMPKIRMDLKSYPTLKKIGIGGAIIGGGLLAASLLRKKDETTKMSSRVKVIDFAAGDQYRKALKRAAGYFGQTHQPVRVSLKGLGEHDLRYMMGHAEEPIKITLRQMNEDAARIAAAERNRPLFKKYQAITGSKRSMSQERDIAAAQLRILRRNTNAAAPNQRLKEAHEGLREKYRSAQSSAASALASEREASSRALNAARAAADENLSKSLSEKDALHKEAINSIRSKNRKKIAAATGAGILAGGYGARQLYKPEEETQFGSIEDASVKLYLKLTGMVTGSERAARDIIRKKIAPIGTIRRAILPIIREPAKKAMIPVPGSTEAGVANGIRKAATNLTNRIPFIRERQIDKLMSRINERRYSAAGPIISLEKKETHPAIVAGASAALTGGLYVGIPAALRTGSKAMQVLKSAGKAAALTGGVAGGGVLIGNALIGKPREEEQAAYTKRAALGGAIGGGAAGLAGGLLAMKTQKGRAWMAEHAKDWKPLAWAGKSIPKAMAVGATGGAGYGLYQGVDEGSGVDALHSGKKVRMSSRATTIQFAPMVETISHQGLTGKLAADRYRKRIQDEDADRRDANLLRTGAAGAGLGLLLRGGLSKRAGAAIGAGAGVASVLGIRAATKNTSDLYGERSREAKQVEGIPWKAAALAGAGVLGKRGIDKLRAMRAKIPFESRSRVVQFERDPYAKWTGGKSGKVNVERRSEDLQRYGRRIKGMASDIGGFIKGAPAVDERGRPRKREWDKPWVKAALWAAAIGTAYKGANVLHRASQANPNTALSEIFEMGRNGELTKGIHNRFPFTKKVTDFFSKTNQNIANETASGVENSGLAGKVRDKLKEWAKSAPKTDPAGAAGPTAAQKAAEKAKKEAEAAARRKMGEMGLSSKLRTINFWSDNEFNPDLEYRHYTGDRHKQWLMSRPGIVQRERRPKKFHETKAFDNAVIKPGIGAAGLMAGMLIGMRMKKPGSPGISIPHTQPHTPPANLAEELMKTIRNHDATPLIHFSRKLDAILHN